MAHAAIGELLGVDLIFGDEFFSERKLVGCGPVQIKNFVARADEFFRRTMAVEAPFHVKRVRLPGQRHSVELAVARRATDAVADVNAVVEKNKIRRVVDAIPAERFIFREAVADGRKHGSVFPDLRMTRHAGFGRRHPGERGFFDGRVAETAVNAESENMMLVAERNRLFERNHFACRIGRPINGVQNPAASANQKQCANNARSGD